MRRASATRSPVSTTSPGRSLKQGVIRVDGDVVIDTSIWNDFQAVEGPVPPIFVNDNLVDVEVTGAAEGEPATIEIVPQTDYFTAESDVETVAEDGETALSVTASEDDPTTLVVSGTIAAGHTQLTMHRVPDAADWARALFIEALERAGIEVAAELGDSNDESALAASDSYPADQRVAELTSPTLGQMGTMIMEMSYNAGANAFLCLLAVERGSENCIDGLETVYELTAEAGIEHRRAVPGRRAGCGSCVDDTAADQPVDAVVARAAVG